MPSHPHLCFDRLLPRDLHSRPALAMLPPPVRAAILLAKRWPNGSVLPVSFLGGTARQQGLVRLIAPQWSAFAHLTFAFTNAPDAVIRIAFDASDGAWSYLGTDCAEIPLGQPTMNLGWQEPGVILHEFGHALGLIHEHQSPAGGMHWNKPVVYAALGGPPNYWTQAMVDHNVFDTYDGTLTQYTTLDPASIMMYSFPVAWTLDGFTTQENEALSSMDRTFIGSAAAYPKPSVPVTPPRPLILGTRPVKAKLAIPGQEDLYTFEVTTSGRTTVVTTGSTDVLLTLYGPDSPTQRLAQDDNSGYAMQARIRLWLTPGAYLLQVRHADQTRTGSYGLKVF
jgi:hypothetical protein